jgi:hypothetical protein
MCEREGCMRVHIGNALAAQNLQSDKALNAQIQKVDPVNVGVNPCGHTTLAASTTDINHGYTTTSTPPPQLPFLPTGFD